jgi:hypothetical protein
MFRSRPSFACAVAVLLGFLCSVSSSLYAQDWSAVSQFSSANNPNGEWSYGFTPSLGANLLGWELAGAEPWVLGNPTGKRQDCGTGQTPTNLLDIHPGEAGQYSVVRWTAPTAGQFRIAGSFEGIDPRPTTTDVHVLLDGVPLFNGEIGSFKVPMRFDFVKTLNAGDTVDFAVGYGTDGNFLNDSTGLTATIDQIWSAVRQFSSANNPNGSWSYGSTPSLGGAFTLLTSGRCASLLGWAFEGAEPFVLGNPTGKRQSCGTGQVPTNLLDMHPGAEGQYSVVRWTAPAAGQFRIRGLFEGIDPHPTTTDVHVLLNGVPIFDGEIGSYGVPMRFNLVEALNAGETIDFAVGFGTDGNFLYDSTGLSATIE